MYMIKRMLRYSLIWRLFIGIIYWNFCSSEPALYCDFDAAQKNSTELLCTCDGFPCSLIQSQDDQLDWVTWQGSTPSGPTGPSDDHTQKTGNGSYIYVEVSDKNQNNKARIFTNPFKFVDESCLSFWYHMYGQHVGILEVDIVLDDRSVSHVWRKNGEQRNSWKEVRIILQPTLKQVMFTATKTGTVSQPYGDIALDDIIIDRFCPGTTPSPNPAPTPSPTTTLTQTPASKPNSTPNLTPTPALTPSPTTSPPASPASSPGTSTVGTAYDPMISSAMEEETMDKQDKSSAVITGIIVVVVVLVVACTITTVVFLVLRHRRRQNTKEETSVSYINQNVTIEETTSADEPQKHGQYEDVIIDDPHKNELERQSQSKHLKGIQHAKKEIGVNYVNQNVSSGQTMSSDKHQKDGEYEDVTIDDAHKQEPGPQSQYQHLQPEKQHDYENKFNTGQYTTISY